MRFGSAIAPTCPRKSESVGRRYETLLDPIGSDADESGGSGTHALRILHAAAILSLRGLCLLSPRKRSGAFLRSSGCARRARGVVQSSPPCPPREQAPLVAGQSGYRDLLLVVGEVSHAEGRWRCITTARS